MAKEQTNWYERIVLFGVIALAAVWSITPTFASLEATRHYWLIGATIAVVASGIAIEVVAERIDSWVLGSALTAVALTAGVLTLLSGSGRFAQIELALAGAMAGVTIGSLWRGKDQPVRGVGLAFSIGLICILTLGRLYSFSEIPTLSYAMIGLAPVALLVFLLPPLRRLEGLKSIAVCAAVTITVLVAAIVVAVVVDPSVIDVES